MRKISIGAALPIALAATDELHDFKTIVRLHRSPIPLGPRQNPAVVLYGSTLGRYLEVGEQTGHREPVGDLTLFAIDADGHRRRSRSSLLYFHENNNEGVQRHGFDQHE